MGWFFLFAVLFAIIGFLLLAERSKDLDRVEAENDRAEQMKLAREQFPAEAQLFSTLEEIHRNSVPSWVSMAHVELTGAIVCFLAAAGMVVLAIVPLLR